MALPMDAKEHHKKAEYCMTRPAYRQGRDLKAVKVYTVSQESRYLLVQGVPALGAHQELVKQFALYGTVEEYNILDKYPHEDFTEVFLIKFKNIQSARVAKRKLDDTNFFGGSLHICYAPEYESVDDVRDKLACRRKDVARRLRQLSAEKDRTEIAFKAARPTELEEINEESEKSQQTQNDNVQNRLLQHAAERVEPEDTDSCQLMPVSLPPPPVLPPPPMHPPPPWLAHPLYPPPPFHRPHRPIFPHNRPPINAMPGLPVMQRLPMGGDRPVTPSLKDGISNADVAYTIAKSEDSDSVKGDKQENQEAHDNTAPLVKDYKVKTNAKFVPRQLTRPKPKPINQESLRPPQVSHPDPVNEGLKRNALKLGNVMGPHLPDEEDEIRKMERQGQESLDKVTMEIRQKVMQFSASALPPQVKKRKLHDKT